MAQVSSPNAPRPRPAPVSRVLLTALLLAIAALWALHWVHLQADFPNNSPWMDYSKYTDEGWYGKAAIAQTLFGHWRVPGDLNTAVALPVWPALEWLAFRLAGVSADTARALALLVFAADLALAYAVLRAARSTRVAAASGVLLLAGSMYLWCFSRLAILEPLLALWILAGWWLALRLPGLGVWLAGGPPVIPLATPTANYAAVSPASPLAPASLPQTLASRLTGQPLAGASGLRDTPELPPQHRTLALCAIGLLGCLAVLTKTTALFLLPATAAIIAAAAGWQLRRTLRDLAIATAAGVLPWLAYYVLVARRYLVDFRYFFAANHWPPPVGVRAHLLAYWNAVHDLIWVGPNQVLVTTMLLVLALWLAPGFRRHPLLQASVLSSAGLIVFMGWHNSPQPRYYIVLAYPVVFVAILAIEALLRNPGRRHRVLAGMGIAALALVFLRDSYGSLWYARHPEYTLRDAATALTRYIDTHPTQGRRLLLSISGDEITLITHLPAVCDDFGSDPLPDRIRRYQPGWYAAWNEVDPGTLEDIQSAGYSIQPVAHWHAFDDEDRDDLILYRMLPATHPAPAVTEPQP
ncbi:hypothetical protein [Acidipila sp. EB88]|uniref:hypothetical protein n=1 Tax=Acidipila sp. EB88 TaxID=2305226 RepID=UPI000F5F04B9|nr:hypothetical protein [Acidipila sp. EB88]RRA48493.1 hypothetical protein D1Y84_09525 [Acidipila sp. EB88]